MKNFLNTKGKYFFIIPIFFLGIVVFGQESSTGYSFKSPDGAPVLSVEPLLDPNVSIVNPPQMYVSPTIDSKNITTDEFGGLLPSIIETSGGELEEIEASLDIWLNELENIDINIMEIQRGAPSASIISNDDEPLVNDDKNSSNLKRLKDNRELFRDVVIRNFGENISNIRPISKTKNIDFNPNDITGELETDNFIQFRKLDSSILQKSEKFQKRASPANKIAEERNDDTDDDVVDVEIDINKDTDEDGILDYDEINLYETNPLDKDTDKDGYSDGVEILVGFDPTDRSAGAIIKYENPKNSAIKESDIFSVKKIEIIDNTNDVVNKNSRATPTQILIEGKGLPNSFVTLYIFSIPTIVTVKTDSDGSWMYILDKEIEDGSHELYVTTTDNSGRILAKKNAIPFTKEALAITVDTNLLTPSLNVEQPGFFRGTTPYLLILFFVAVIAGFIMFVGGKNNEDEFNLN